MLLLTEINFHRGPIPLITKLEDFGLCPSSASGSPFGSIPSQGIRVDEICVPPQAGEGGGVLDKAEIKGPKNVAPAPLKGKCSPV